MTGQFYGDDDEMIPTFPRESEKTRQFHGGDLGHVQATFGHDMSAWLDLSTGINPVPYPLPPLAEDHWRRLPGFENEARLIKVARQYYGLSGKADICAFPGTQAAIQILPRLIPLTEVAVLIPTYNEHAVCWRRAGHRVREVDNISAIPDTTTIVILVHPNNPDGRTYSRSTLRDLARTLNSRNGCLIIDEAFSDVMPELSLMPELPDDGILILKSFGKFFGLAGLRLGFLAGPPDFIRVIQQEVGPWAISGVALEIGTQALSDTTWIASTRNQLEKASRRLSALLGAANLKIIGGTDLFCLTESPHSPSLFQHLCEGAILVRTFPDHPERLRFGLPRTETDWVRLEGRLNSWAKR